MNEEVRAALDAIENPTRRADAIRLNEIMQSASGFQPKLWGKIISYGSYDYTYASGRSGTSLATGFAPQKTKLSLYIMPGYADFAPLLARLGKHKTGKACLYINKLADINEAVLQEIIKAGLQNLATRWPITPT
ncbi:MAG: hypothetical protein ACJA2X_000775 [Halocynthiibacter sp.]|jgi:hypothetical protein